VTDKRHGGPYDRGGADSYYRRPFKPHYFRGKSYQSEMVTDLTPEETLAYSQGWADNEEWGDHKDWGQE
jgi:hypothetical protein